MEVAPLLRPWRWELAQSSHAHTLAQRQLLRRPLLEGRDQALLGDAVCAMEGAAEPVTRAVAWPTISFAHARLCTTVYA